MKKKGRHRQGKRTPSSACQERRNDLGWRKLLEPHPLLSVVLLFFAFTRAPALFWLCFQGGDAPSARGVVEGVWKEGVERSAEFSVAAALSALRDIGCGRAGFLPCVLFQVAFYEETFLPSLLLSVRGLCKARESVFFLSGASACVRPRFCSSALRRGFERSYSRLEACGSDAACSVVCEADDVSCAEGVSQARPCRSCAYSSEEVTATFVQSGCAACAPCGEGLGIADCAGCVEAESLYASVGGSSSAAEVACVKAYFFVQACGEGSGEVGFVDRRCDDERLDGGVLRKVFEARGGERG